MPACLPLDYDRLSAMPAGYADALLDHYLHCDIGEDWVGIGHYDFGVDALFEIVDACERFLIAAGKVHPLGEEYLLDEIDAYELGRCFYLARQGTGVGFVDLPLGGLSARLDRCAVRFGRVEPVITADRQIGFNGLGCRTVPWP